jgi:hypothetical protein
MRANRRPASLAGRCLLRRRQWARQGRRRALFLRRRSRLVRLRLRTPPPDGRYRAGPLLASRPSSWTSSSSSPCSVLALAVSPLTSPPLYRVRACLARARSVTLNPAGSPRVAAASDKVCVWRPLGDLRAGPSAPPPPCAAPPLCNAARLPKPSRVGYPVGSSCGLWGFPCALGAVQIPLPIFAVAVGCSEDAKMTRLRECGSHFPPDWCPSRS